jgi:hypothetical protein
MPVARRCSCALNVTWRGSREYGSRVIGSSTVQMSEIVGAS